jgi:hypothetical protein
MITEEIDELFAKTRNAIEKVDSAGEELKTYFSVFAKTMKKKVNLYNIIKGKLIENLLQLKELIKKYKIWKIHSLK